MKISDYLANQPYQPLQQGQKSTAMSQHTGAFTQDNTINFTTKEGDKVSLSQSFAASFSLVSQSENDANGSKQSLNATTMQSASVSLQVVGDLNEEELADIQKLLENLYSIAEDFFNGKQDKALDGVNELTNDMGTIANLSASFYQTQMVTSYTSSVTNGQQHQASLQDATAQLSSGLQNLEENDRSDFEFVNDILKVQWQQISEMLDLFNTELHEENAKLPEPTNNPTPLLVGAGITGQDELEEDRDNTKSNNHAKQMMDRVADTMRQHPRLQPFSGPIVTSVIDKVAETNNDSDSQLVTTLKKDFAEQFDQWLMS